MNGLRSLIDLRLIMVVCVFMLAACAPADLDITPSAVPTLPPTATPPPTPLPDDFVDPNLVNQAIIDQIVEALPANLPAGAVQWRRDLTRGEDGIEAVARAENGVGTKVYYNEQTGGQMNLTFATFDTLEDAAAHYEFIQGIRQPLENGDENDTFPTPNIFGSGLYGSVAIFQIDEVFIEVNIELFSSTQGNPLIPLSRVVTNFYDGLELE